MFIVLELRKSLDLKPPPDSREVTMIVKASSTLTTIIQTFENRTTEQAEFENLLSGHFNFLLPFPSPPPPPPPASSSPPSYRPVVSVSSILFTSIRHPSTGNG
jgi:hypothetical protein